MGASATLRMPRVGWIDLLEMCRWILSAVTSPALEEDNALVVIVWLSDYVRSAYCANVHVKQDAESIVYLTCCHYLSVWLST